MQIIGSQHCEPDQNRCGVVDTIVNDMIQSPEIEREEAPEGQSICRHMCIQVLRI